MHRFDAMTGHLVELTPDEEAAFLASLPETIVPVGIVSKAEIFRRMTDGEAATFATVKALQSTRMQLLFDGASELHNNAAEWPLLVSLFEAAYGVDRAAELLAASA